MFEQPFADVGRPGPGSAIEQRRAVHDDAAPAAALDLGAEFAHHVLEE